MPPWVRPLYPSDRLGETPVWAQPEGVPGVQSCPRTCPQVCCSHRSRSSTSWRAQPPRLSPARRLAALLPPLHLGAPSPPPAGLCDAPGSRTRHLTGSCPSCRVLPRGRRPRRPSGIAGAPPPPLGVVCRQSVPHLGLEASRRPLIYFLPASGAPCPRPPAGSARGTRRPVPVPTAPAPAGSRYLRPGTVTVNVPWDAPAPPATFVSLTTLCSTKEAPLPRAQLPSSSRGRRLREWWWGAGCPPQCRPPAPSRDGQRSTYLSPVPAGRRVGQRPPTPQAEHRQAARGRPVPCPHGLLQ